MKKKKRFISVGIVAAVILLCAVGFGVYCLSFYVGTYVEARDGMNIVVFDDNPIVMSDKTPRGLFEGLETGDRVLVIHGFIEETYPARSEAKLVFKLGGGSIDDIPQVVTDNLIEMGWLESEISNDFSVDNSVKDFDSTVSWANWGEDSRISISLTQRLTWNGLK